MKPTPTIVIGFSSPAKPSLFSKLIRFAENQFMNSKVNYSHVYIRFDWRSIDRVVIFQTNKHGAHFIEFNNFIKSNTIHKEYEIDIDPVAFKTAIQTCVDCAAKAYGFKEIIGIAFTRLYNKWFNQKKRNPLRDGDATYVCSALTAKILESAGFSIFGQYDWEYYGPIQVEKLLSELFPPAE